MRSSIILSMVFSASLASFGCNTQGSVPAPAASAPAATASPQAPVLVPGTSIGPVAIGMSRSEVDRLGLEVRPHPSRQFGDNVRMVGPYYVVFGDDGSVDSVELRLASTKPGLRVGDATIPSTASMKEAAKLIPGCGEVEVRLGGNLIRCENKTLVKAGAMSPDDVEVQVHRHDFR